VIADIAPQAFDGIQVWAVTWQRDELQAVMDVSLEVADHVRAICLRFEPASMSCAF
jgi:hypothetical protein